MVHRDDIRSCIEQTQPLLVNSDRHRGAGDRGRRPETAIAGSVHDDAGGPDTFLHINELKTAGIDPNRIRGSIRNNCSAGYRRLTFDFDLACIPSLFVIRAAVWLATSSSSE
jgi:hypothetical protein